MVQEPDETPEVLEGTVFEDLNSNSVRDDGEPGIAHVVVSNGREVVTTDADGAYELPAFDCQSVPAASRKDEVVLAGAF